MQFVIVPYYTYLSLYWSFIQPCSRLQQVVESLGRSPIVESSNWGAEALVPSPEWQRDIPALALGIQEWLCFPPCEGVQAIPGQCLFRGKHRCRSRVYIRITCVIFIRNHFDIITIDGKEQYIYICYIYKPNKTRFHAMMSFYSHQSTISLEVVGLFRRWSPKI